MDVATIIISFIRHIWFVCRLAIHVSLLLINGCDIIMLVRTVNQLSTTELMVLEKLLAGQNQLNHVVMRDQTKLPGRIPLLMRI